MVLSSMGSYGVPSALHRVGQGVGALLLADALVGLTAFSSISLAGLWVFAVSWVRLDSEYRSAGLTFGAPWQLELAWVGGVACLPMLVIVVTLGCIALKTPVRLFRGARRVAPRP